MPLGDALQDRVLWYLVAGIAVIIAFVFLFAALAILLRIKNHQRAAKWQLLEEVWEPLIMEVLYGEDPVSRLWQLVAPSDRMFFVDFLLRYARRLVGDEHQRLIELAQPYLPLVAQELHRRGAERRAKAVQILGELGMPEYAKDLVRALDDDSMLVAMAAARGLARQEHPQYAGALVACLHRFMHWRRSFLAAMMSSMGADAGPALQRALADPRQESGVRVVAALALAQLHHAPSADMAAKIVKDDPDREVVAASLRLLSKVGRPEDLGLVRAKLGAPDAVVRGAAAAALGYLGGPVDAMKLNDVAMGDPSRWVAIAAARALRDLGGVKSLRELAASPHRRASLALQILSEANG